MIVKCGWCGKDLGEKEPLENRAVTHGMCLDCEAKVNAQLDARDNNGIMPPVQSPGLGA